MVSADAPDYTGAAEAQAKSSKDVTNQQTWANRPTLNTPWGKMDWQTSPTIDPATGQQVTSWTGNITLNPEQQAALDAQQQIQLGRSDIAQSLMGRASTELGTPIDWASLPSAGKGVGGGSDYQGRAEDAIYQRAAARLDPQWAQREEQTRAQLAHQGLDPGSEAYNNAMGNLDRARNDAYSSAINDAITGSGAEASRMQGQDLQASQYQNDLRARALAEQQQRQGMSLNLINAALTGQQVGMPEMPGFSQASKSDATNYLGAAQAQGQFNLAQSQQANQMMGDIMGGAGGLASGLMMFSDSRLKRNIRRSSVEIIPGVRLARWEWLDGSSGFGVIAQDVQRVAPQLVSRHASGYLMVDYGGI